LLSIDAETSLLELHAQPVLARDLSTLAAGESTRGLTSEILERGEVFIIKETEAGDFFGNPLAIEEGIRSLIAVPPKSQTHTINPC